MARGLWILGRPPVFGDGRCGAKQLHSASERSVEYMVMQPSVRCRRLARATFQTVSERLSEKYRRRPKRGFTGYRSGTVRPVLGTVWRPDPPSEGGSNPFSDSLWKSNSRKFAV